MVGQRVSRNRGPLSVAPRPVGIPTETVPKVGFRGRVLRWRNHRRCLCPGPVHRACGDSFHSPNAYSAPMVDIHRAVRPDDVKDRATFAVTSHVACAFHLTPATATTLLVACSTALSRTVSTPASTG